MKPSLSIDIYHPDNDTLQCCVTQIIPRDNPNDKPIIRSRVDFINDSSGEISLDKEVDGDDWNTIFSIIKEVLK